jgi:RsiW-degrading membrane proteinase PrsW (M82 family)
LHASGASLGRSIFTIGVPEELAKALPVLAVVLIYRRWRNLTPRDYLFIGAVSGLAFGASEVVRYFTVNGVLQFYLTVQSAIPTIERLISTGHSASTSLFAVLIGPVLNFILDFVWRFVTDPVSHACWSGLTGYFIGLAAARRHHWLTVSWIGLAAAAILHGLNDWSRVNGHLAWILVVLVSGILFLGYAKVGSARDLQPSYRGERPLVLPDLPTSEHPLATPASYPVPPAPVPTGPGNPGGNTKAALPQPIVAC